MKMAGCISLLLQLFLHLHQSAASFFKPILLMFLLTCFLHFIFCQPCLRFPSTLCTIGFTKHLLQVVSKHEHTNSHYLPLPAYLLLPSTQHVHQLHGISLVHQLYIAHCSNHRSFCSSQNSYFIFSQTTHFFSTVYNIVDLT